MLDEGKILMDLGRPRILVVGDLILDIYAMGRVERISPEAPIPVFQGGERTYKLGGAGNVAANLHDLGARVSLAGLVGADPEGERVKELLADQATDLSRVVAVPGRPTTCKTRLLSRDQQLLRWDEEESGRPGGEAEEGLLAGLERGLDDFDGVVLSDYAKGVLSPRVLARVLELAAGAQIPVVVDPKGMDYGRYRGATYITPNRAEAELATGITIEGPETLAAAGRKLLATADLEAAVITLGMAGIFYLTREGESATLPARALSVYDVTGAGDTVVSVLALCRAGGVPLADSLRICNAAAGIVVGRLGAVTVTREEVARSLGGDPCRRKVVREEDLEGLLARLRREGRRIAFTNGCFDVLHAGHTRFLQAARVEGDLLLVAVNDDDSVRRLKGPGRPVNELADRMEVLAALETVDFVLSFGEDTPEETIRRVCPDVLVKGEDWREKGVVGREWVEAGGGRVVLVPLAPGRSTSSILERMAGKKAPPSGKPPR